MMKRILSIFLCWGLSGCTFIPHYRQPALPVPQQFPYTHGQTASGNPAYAIAWQDFFKDARLQKLIGLALANNRDYRTALLNVEQLQAQYRIIQYALIPSFQIDATASQGRQLLGNSISGLHSYQIDINTAYEVDLFGHIRSLQAQALEQYFATQESARAAQITLVSQVAVEYLTEQALMEQLVLLNQTLKAVSSYSDLINKSYQLGNSSALDLKLAQAQVQTAQANIANYERLRAQADDALMLLVGQPIPDDLPAAQSLANQDMMQDMPVGLSSDLLEQRPDILEAEHQLKAANANIGVVKAAFFPSITLTASDGTASAKLAELFKHNVWSFSPDITLPLFNQNANLANLRAARIGAQIQVAQYEKTVQEAFREVSDAIIARDTYNQQLKAQRQLVDADQVRYDLSGARYKNGIDSYLTVLLAQQDLYNARATLIQVSLDRFTNLISLYKALGGGWKQK